MYDERNVLGVPSTKQYYPRRGLLLLILRTGIAGTHENGALRSAI
ncbi:MAG: hypothetical protein AAF843_05255 [Bacteroidota bacterium]